MNGQRTQIADFEHENIRKMPKRKTKIKMRITG
jgi:hypothetical protein